MDNIEFLCLATANQDGTGCLAGLRCDGLGWVRMISAEPTDRLTVSRPQLLDVVCASVNCPRPVPHHPENWLLDGGECGVTHWPAPDACKPLLARAVSRGPLLFGSQEAYERQDEISESLVVIAPQRFRWHVSPQCQAEVDFYLGAARYHLPVTDPGLALRMQPFKPGEYGTGEIGLDARAKYLFTLSLSPPVNGICHKIVAGVVQVPKHWRSGT